MVTLKRIEAGRDQGRGSGRGSPPLYFGPPIPPPPPGLPPLDHRLYEGQRPPPRTRTGPEVRVGHAVRVGGGGCFPKKFTKKAPLSSNF